MRRAGSCWRAGVASVALLAGVGAARAVDEGLFAVAQAGAVLDVPGGNTVVDYALTGALREDAKPALVPQLPPDTPPADAAQAAPSSPPPAPTPTTTADRLPAALDALVARPGVLTALGAGDWRKTREAVKQFYSTRQFAPAWTDAKGFNSAGRSALARLAKAGEDGLDLKPFTLPATDYSETDPDKLAVLEASVSSAVAVYGLEASGARIVPTSISPDVTAHAEIVDPAKALADVAAAADPDAALKAFNPPQEGYRRLREKLSQLAAPRAAANFDGAQVIRAAVGVDTDAPRRAAILANMEMWRWEPREMGRDRIEINVPDYTLHLIQNDAEVEHSRVIVGKPQTPTPIFSNAIKYLLVNPIWRVPPSIVQKEMLPHASANPGYFARMGYTVKNIRGQMFVEQPPGPANALGRILFMFPNEHSVYLHDTPARGLFSAAKRAFSHGCIRVEQPLHLAVEVMGGAANGWSTQKVEGLLGANERAVSVPAPLPIHIEYFTEFVDDEGMLREREDVYGLTARVAATLSRISQD